MKTAVFLLLMAMAAPAVITPVLAVPSFDAASAGAPPINAASAGAPAINTASAGAPAVADTFANPQTEERARSLQRQLRCLVCQGESIDESGSDVAADLRHLVRRQIAEGRSNQQIEDYLVARYGDFILMKPPVQPNTWILWLAPFAVLATGGAVAWFTVKKAAARNA